MRICGIDVGLSGGLAVIERRSGDLFSGGLFVGGVSDRIVAVSDILTFGEGPGRRVNAPALRQWILSHHPDHAIIEGANAYPGQGVSSSFRYGRAAGALESIVACCDVPWSLVAPVSWKKHFGLKGPDKEQDRVLAIQRFPAAASLMARKADHGIADAILIALYGLETIAKRKVA